MADEKYEPKLNQRALDNSVNTRVIQAAVRHVGIAAEKVRGDAGREKLREALVAAAQAL